MDPSGRRELSLLSFNERFRRRRRRPGVGNARSAVSPLERSKIRQGEQLPLPVFAKECRLPFPHWRNPSRSLSPLQVIRCKSGKGGSGGGRERERSKIGAGSKEEAKGGKGEAAAFRRRRRRGGIQSSPGARRSHFSSLFAFLLVVVLNVCK